jgi:hypothetical protein
VLERLEGGERLLSMGRLAESLVHVFEPVHRSPAVIGFGLTLLCPNIRTTVIKLVQPLFKPPSADALKPSPASDKYSSLPLHTKGCKVDLDKVFIPFIRFTLSQHCRYKKRLWDTKRGSWKTNQQPQAKDEISPLRWSYLVAARRCGRQCRRGC